MDMDEVEVKIEPDLFLEHLRNEVIADDEIKTEKIEMKIEPDGFPNLPPLPLEQNHERADTSAKSTSEFKILKSPKKEVEEVPDCFEVILDSESNCVEIKEEVEEKYTPPPLPDPLLFCNPVLSSLGTKNKKKAVQPVKCSECLLEFPTNIHLQTHIKSKHEKAKKYKQKCPICQKRFQRKAQLNLHKIREHPQKKQCSKCPMTFTTAFRLQNHEDSAHFVKKEFQCSTCDLKFSSENILQLHEKFTHPKTLENDVKNVIKTESIPPPPMKKPDIIFPEENPILTTNYKIKHGGNFRCPLCPSSFRSQLGLASHKRAHMNAYNSIKIKSHEKPRKFNCTKCSESFENISRIVTHAKSHGDDFPCTICPGIFVSKYYLLTHRRDAHPECQVESTDDGRYKCQSCNKILATLEETKQHEESHRKYSCDLCPDFFDTLNTMKRHRQFLHPECMQYLCSKCPLYFPTPKDRQKHLKTHKETIRLTIKCWKCSITFTTLLEKAKHEEEFHPKDLPILQNESKSEPISKEDMSFTKPFKIQARNYVAVRCHLCPKVFLSKKSLLNHKISKHPTNRRATNKVKKKPVESVMKPEDVFVTPENVKTEFISGQSEPAEDTILGF